MQHPFRWEYQTHMFSPDVHILFCLCGLFHPLFYNVMLFWKRVLNNHLPNIDIVLIVALPSKIVEPWSPAAYVVSSQQADSLPRCTTQDRRCNSLSNSLWHLFVPCATSTGFVRCLKVSSEWMRWMVDASTACLQPQNRREKRKSNLCKRYNPPCSHSQFPLITFCRIVWL